MRLRLGRTTFAETDLVVMAIINRTPDSFFDKGATFADETAMSAVDLAVASGAARLLRQHFNPIAQREPPTLDHFGMDAEVRVAVETA